MDYNFREIENKWQKFWTEKKTFEVKVDLSRPKYYVLDMFPYPSGAGLHVGHPLGYIASDIYARYKRLNGFNVLHPMGYDAFGLPAEQYAIQTGQHPAITTNNNIARYRSQLDKIGFSYDWSREIKTCDPDYYKWTQWVFIQLFNHWFNNKTHKAEPIQELTEAFSKYGNSSIEAACSPHEPFTATEWNGMNEKQQQEMLLNYRLAYLADTMVNWCPALGTVLANDEVKDGFSVRGNHPVVQKEMRQWLLRVSAYTQRLLDGMETINWTDSLKEIQKNWIGRSEGALMDFKINPDKNLIIKVFTTRPDTIFGCTFMVLAPEHELVNEITTAEYKQAVKNYTDQTKKRTERERIAETKKISGQFTGAYAEHPFTGKPLPIWISDYVLAGYGTGAIMAVPAHDSRDYVFAKTYELPIIEVVSGGNISEESYDAKEGSMINSDFLNGLSVAGAISRANEEIEKLGIGVKKVNFRMRDAIFSRQRYWGEPFPVYYKDEMPYPLPEEELPLLLPEVDAYLPTEKGEPPLGRAKNWETEDGYPLELSTMPGFAGSSAYYLRYMDPGNDKALVSKEANSYWQDVDLYIGGTEHATGHLIYSRFWNKFLFDIGLVCKDEPFKKLINQGMIQGRSNFVYRIKNTHKFVSLNLKDNYDASAIHVDVNIVHNDILDIEAFKKWNPEYASAEFILEPDGKYHCGWAVEKMSKSLYNVVNPDDIIEKYGADTLRMYEMFLGPLEQSKPWDTNGIEGVHKFYRKLWKLFHNSQNQPELSDEEPGAEELKVLHKTIKKVKEDIENFSFNTSVSAFMICVNELSSLKCNKRKILNDLVIILSPFAPHVAEELWEILGNKPSVADAKFPEYNPAWLVESMIEYPVSFNGKMRLKINLNADLTPSEIEKEILQDAGVQKFLQGSQPKKIIVVPKKIVNIVV
jgi:leucyl-tRNA synthetase